MKTRITHKIPTAAVMLLIIDARHETARRETFGLSRVPCQNNMQFNLEQLLMKKAISHQQSAFSLL